MNTTTCIVGDSICGSVGESKLFAPDDVVFLRGFNTYEGDRPSDAAAAQEGGGEIMAAINGLIEVTDRVVSVKGMSSRYHAEIGDIVIGRVKEVSGNRWRVDIGSYQEAVMLLSNVSEPGGILRRRGRSDELTMRHIFDEDELIVAEVQRVTPDGVVSLHTRSGEKYGRLSGVGSLVMVSPALVKRDKHHFLTLDYLPVSVTVGTNGMIWVSSEGVQKDDSVLSKPMHGGSDVDVRRSVARVTNCIKVLGRTFLPVFARSIDAAVKSSMNLSLDPFGILLPLNQDLIAAAVMENMAARKRPR